MAMMRTYLLNVADQDELLNASVQRDDHLWFSALVKKESEIWLVELLRTR